MIFNASAAAADWLDAYLSRDIRNDLVSERPRLDLAHRDHIYSERKERARFSQIIGKHLDQLGASRGPRRSQPRLGPSLVSALVSRHASHYIGFLDTRAA